MTYPRQSLFQRKMSCLGKDSNPRHSTLKTERSTTELPRQLSWLAQILHLIVDQMNRLTITCISKHSASEHEPYRQSRLEPVVILRNRHMTIAHRVIFAYAISA